MKGVHVEGECKCKCKFIYWAQPQKWAVWWSQIRPVQDSYESGTATVAVTDSYRARIRLRY